MVLKPIKQSIVYGLLFAVLILAGFSFQAGACVICVPYPTKTVADYLVDSETVVLARENPDRPWFYLPVETIKGQTTHAPIDNFITSTTRRRLISNPERSVVLVKDAKQTSGWRTLGYADVEYEDMIREIVQRAPNWHQKDPLNQARLNFFASYLGHENRTLHNLAYLEVGKAPYDQIRHLDSGWSIEQIRALLGNSWYIEWYPLAILMLATKGNERDHDYIQDKFSILSGLGTTLNLSAWTTALIEILEAEAVTRIEEEYFRSPTRSREELVAVISALSEHGNSGHTYLRNQIILTYSTLLDVHPGLADFVVRDLLTWRRWELSDQLGAILTDLKNTDPLAANAVRLYLLQAKAMKRLR